MEDAPGCSPHRAMGLSQDAMRCDCPLPATRRVAIRACAGLLGLASDTSFGKHPARGMLVASFAGDQRVGDSSPLVVGILGSVVLSVAGADIQFSALAL